MKRFLLALSFFGSARRWSEANRYICNNARMPVFHQAGCNIAALAGHAALSHDPGHKPAD